METYQKHEIYLGRSQRKSQGALSKAEGAGRESEYNAERPGQQRSDLVQSFRAPDEREEHAEASPRT